MKKLRNSTLLFLVKKRRREIIRLCLAMKKIGFGAGRWNGSGGKVKEAEETIEEAAVRETREEIGVFAENLIKVAELSFYFPHNPLWNQKVHVYFSTRWQGALKESREMKPRWFLTKNIPFEKMWPDDIFWLPLVLQGKFVKACFKFKENDVIISQKITVVKKI